MTPTPETLKALVEKHARVAVLPLQHQNDSYQPTAYEANALKNMRHILSQFAAALSAVPEPHEPVTVALLKALNWEYVVTLSCLNALLSSLEGTPETPTADISAKYHELLYQVSRKHPGESRHETALRYIQQAERGSDKAQACAASSITGET